VDKRNTIFSKNGISNIVFQINNFKKPDRFLKPVRFGTEIIFMKNYSGILKLPLGIA